MALLDEACEMFAETGCVPGIDGEEVPAETIVPEAKEYISQTIDDPEAIYDPEIWDTSEARLAQAMGGAVMQVSPGHTSRASRSRSRRA